LNVFGENIGDPDDSEDLSEETARTMEPYKELPDEQWFRKIFRLLLKAKKSIPQSRTEVFLQKTNLVATLYPFVVEVKGKRA
jgi:hypothetical protein